MDERRKHTPAPDVTEEDEAVMSMLNRHADNAAARSALESDATQRVPVTHAVPHHSPEPEQRRPRAAAPQRTNTTAQRTNTTAQRTNTTAQRSAAASSRNNAAQAAARQKKKRRDLIAIIVLCISAALLIAGIVFSVIYFTTPPEDDHLILNNTYAAGVNIGGMTKELAKNAILFATEDTYTRLDMKVTVLDSLLILSPKQTGASLDVDALVEAAYNRGRTGTRAEQQQARASALISDYHFSLTPYLNLDTDYIREEVSRLGKQYSTTLSQPSFQISGTKPSMDLEHKDTSVVYQKLTIQIGTAEYGLNTGKLYQQIIEAYDSNIFQVEGTCTVNAPKDVDCEEIYNQFCIAPVDATFNPDTYEVTQEVYGYGFHLNDLKNLVATAKYGDKLEIPLTFIRPSQTAEELSGDTFRDVLATWRTKASIDTNYNRNLTIACRAINNLILKPGDKFSFNEAIGQPTIAGGFKSVNIFVGKEMDNVVGGGISQVASTLYVCALFADLDITERSNHTYVTDYSAAGYDTEVRYGQKDFCFVNNTGYALRIEAALVNGYVEVKLIGTNNNDYTVTIEFELVSTYNSTTMHLTMSPDNAGGFKEGDVLVSPITGYLVRVYRNVYAKETPEDPENPEIPEEPTEPEIPVDPDAPVDPENPDGEPIEPVDPNAPLEKELVAESYYDKRNEVIVVFPPQQPEEPTTPDEETMPSLPQI